MYFGLIREKLEVEAFRSWGRSICVISWAGALGSTGKKQAQIASIIKETLKYKFRPFDFISANNM